MIRIFDASTLDGLNGLRTALGLSPLTEEENAAKAARAEQIESLIAIEREEYAQARREREAVLREGQLTGESYDEFKSRLNAPFDRARERIRERMVCPVAEQKPVRKGWHRVAA